MAKLAELQLEDPAAGMKKADNDFAAARAQVNQARTALAEHTLNSPVAGVVIRVEVAAGELAGPQSAWPAVRIAPDGHHAAGSRPFLELAPSPIWFKGIAVQHIVEADKCVRRQETRQHGNARVVFVRAGSVGDG